MNSHSVQIYGNIIFFKFPLKHVEIMRETPNNACWILIDADGERWRAY